MNDDPTPPRPVYPLPRSDDDPRFTFGLLHDISEALQHHGFPHPVGADWAHLMTALHCFLYQKETP